MMIDFCPHINCQWLTRGILFVNAGLLIANLAIQHNRK